MQEELRKLLAQKQSSIPTQEEELAKLLADAVAPKRTPTSDQNIEPEVPNEIPSIPSNLSYSMATNYMDPKTRSYREQLFNQAQQRLQAAPPILDEAQKLYAKTRDEDSGQSRYAKAANFYQIGGLSPAEAATALKPIAPMSDAEKTEALKGLLGQVVEGENRYLQNISSTLKGIDDGSQLARFAASQGLRENKDRDLIFKDVRKSYEPIIKEGYDQIAQIGTIKEALNSGELGSINAAMANLVRLQGEKGPLTEGDIGRNVPNTLKNKIKNWARFVAGGNDMQADPEVINAIKQNLNYIIKSGLKKTESKLAAEKSLFDQGSPNYQDYGSSLYTAALKDWEKRLQKEGLSAEKGQVKKATQRKKL